MATTSAQPVVPGSRHQPVADGIALRRDADREQRALIWCGPAMALIFLIAVWPLAGFVPQPAPSASARAIADRYSENASGIIAAGVLLLIGAVLFVAFCTAISEQITRITRRRSGLATIQLACGVINALWFSLMGMFWIAAAYRAHRAPSTIALFNDISWFIMVVPTAAFVAQVICLGVTILGDRRARPLLPRWYGYLSLWSATLFVPGMFSAFFKHGPIAWNGVLSFWLEATAFVVWIVAITPALIRATHSEVSPLTPIEEPA